MTWRRMWRFAILAASGGVVFQTTTTSCTTQVVEALAATVAQLIATSISDLLLGSLQTGTV